MLFTHLLMVARRGAGIGDGASRGGRNQALFDAVRFAVYGWRHGANLEADLPIRYRPALDVSADSVLSPQIV